MPRGTTSIRSWRRHSLRAGKAAACGTPTATSTSSTEWACAPSLSGTHFRQLWRPLERSWEFGSNFNRPSPVEVQCAESLLSLIDGADQAKFTKDGSTATTAAVKLARAATGRDIVAICGDQGFFSYDDWYIGTTPMDAGIPKTVARLTVTFKYNDIASVKALFAKYPGKIACVMMEPARTEGPRDGFLEESLKLCQENGALLVFDENITGFRLHVGGAQNYYGVVPDLSVFGKAMANGFAVSALVGKREFMELGGLKHDRQRVFLLSTTHGGETHALAAAIATMRVYREEPVIERLARQGKRLADGVAQVAQRHNLQEYVGTMGHPANLIFYTLNPEKLACQEFRSLFLQEMIRRGVLAPSFVVSYSHANDDIDRTVEAVDGALGVYGRAMNDGAAAFLQGPASKPVFRRFN